MSPKPLFFSILSALFNFTALAQTVPTGAQITDVRLLGSGCDMDKASVVLSPDLKDISLFFDDYTVEIGNGSANPNLLSLSKSCQIEVQMQIPDGWQMAFKGADYRGFVSLSAQGTAFHRFSVLQEGAPIVSMKEAFLQGAKNEDYYVRSQVRPERVTWSKCLGGLTTVKLVSQLGVSLNPRHSDRSLTQIVLDSTDTSFKQNLSVDWKRCSVARPSPRARPEPAPRGPITPVRPPRI